MIVDSPRPGNTRALLADLHRLVERNSRRSRRLILLRSLALALATATAVFLGVLLADYYFHLTMGGRVAAFALVTACLLALIWNVFRRWRGARFTEEQIALAIERRSSEVDNRLINTIQLAKDKRVPDARLNEAVIRENHQRLRKLELRQAASLRPLLVGIGAVLVALLAGFGLYALQGGAFKNSLVRILLPLAELNPVYRTVLVVEPGNVEAIRGSDVKLTIRVEGEKPAEVAVTSVTGGQRQTEIISLAADVSQVSHLFRQVQDDITYSVRGGDFRSETYTIKVPAPASLRTLRAEIQAPDYTRLPPAKTESSSGSLEALYGSRAKLDFVFNRPVEKAVMVVQKRAEDGTVESESMTLKTVNASEASGELLLQDVISYQLELTQNGKVIESGAYPLRILADQSPQARIEGLERDQEAEADWTFPLTLVAEDDYGLAQTALAVRKADGAEKEWRILSDWKPDGQTQWKQEATLDLAAIEAAEGDRLEVALLAKDTDPLKQSMPWMESLPARIVVGSQGAQLEILYRQILQSETDIRKLIPAQQEVIDALPPWIRKLEPDSGLRWDDKANIDAFRKAVSDLAGKQEALRARTGEIARSMVEAAGNLRLSLAMLADAEMVRAIQILEGAPDQDHPQRKRAALAETRTTQERTVTSLRDILQQYGAFRQEWENNHMTEFVGMLASRQKDLRGKTKKRQDEKPEAANAEKLQRAAANRQKRLLESTELARAALAAVGGRVGSVEPVLGTAFSDAANKLGGDIKNRMTAAGDLLASGDWVRAGADQEAAAEQLEAVFASLKQATADAAKRALQLSEDKKELAGQQEIEALKAALEENKVKDDNVPVETILKVQNVRQTGGAPGGEPEIDDSAFVLDEKTKAALAVQANAGGDRSKPVITLADKPFGPTKRSPAHDNLPPNAITAPPIPELHDMVGDLLDEADEISKDFDVLNANAAFTVLDSGDVGKMGGQINSHSASAKTGNQKPPTTSSGGASGTGRQGARSHGRNVDDVAINRRGRDQPQEGLETAPMQEGYMKEVMSEDPGEGSSPGMGGKRLDSKEKGWSTMDAGTWRNEYGDKMEKPQEVAKLVDRQGAPLDPRVAALLEDANSTQEQIIVRAKAIRKELNNLFLPTERLDDLIDKIAANLERLRENPDSSLFRVQKEAMDQLRNELQVINRAYAGFHPSLPRERRVNGRVLDEPAWQPLPEYEQAVRKYYESLSAQ